MKKLGLIFDMDGTLWDSSEGVAKSWTIASSRALNEERIITKADIQRIMGLTMDKVAEKIFPDLEYNQRMEVLEICCKDENDYLEKNGGILYPELEETVKRLHEKYHLYIVSNCQSGYIEAFLKHYGFEKYFEDIECYGNNLLTKDKNIKLVFDRNNLDKAYYVGDIDGDYKASKKAGVPFIHAAYGFGEISDKVEKIEEFKELVPLCERLFS